MKSIFAVLAVLAVTGATQVQANTEAATEAKETKAAEPSRADVMARGQQIVGAVCLACHGMDGASLLPANPSIGGMPEQYIVKQLEAFKSGARKNPTMQGMVANLAPSDMKAVAAYYFAQKPKTNAVARDKALAEKGQKIYRAGIASAKVPACAGCHGGAGAGIPANYPRLAGQWPEYTFASLNAYAAGERKHPAMSEVANRLKPAEMQALAEYIAGMRGN